MTQPIEGFDRHVVHQPCFSPTEMANIIAAADADLMDGTIAGQVGDNSIRRSKVHWLDKQTFDWAYRRLWKVVETLNRQHFGFDIERFEGRFQVARYHQDDEGFYTWHMDAGQKTANRKISISVQLTPPQDYLGGTLEFFYTNKNKPAPTDHGSIVAFPSFVMHRVTPIERGVRYSLVAWVVGPRWR
ncbi:2OG-Fe(II) oxygenase [Ferrimonas balearica DSM 9799]|uniref:2OG-Fe(II) oxygenase n=1 Tax=Ferrimonas balearica (strain DSM 9799 / CCM 4581 / KCTC 23876 / PAT) TaxID=550540 RepID=E1SL92_FERBD|nr:2OG-Fe(II) oxygenase [Ferrimonas balearica]ADN75470.1 2OG-Fe(II) oxygenase [Ferrimonas balearica DSM 9799]MBY5979125.1 2OG-Fe(II) oxygenase [Ferrimonas balearica]MBY6105432.1 2OG-Fe(II) oxygenase [Ferrimonas balearica]